MKKFVIIGAGGKMGYRCSQHILEDGSFDPYFCEVSEVGIARLGELGVTKISKMEEIVPEADYVLLAIPDVLIGKLSAGIIPLMKPGAMVIGLDPAAAYADVMPIRDDIGYFVTHPHHPHLFHKETDLAKLNDYFGGVATQDVSCALYRGDEKFYDEGEKIARIIYAPVGKTFRLTIEQMGCCEPGLVESIGSALIYGMKQAYDKMLELHPDIPADALMSFYMGHLRVQFAIIFELIDVKFSDGAYAALYDAMSEIYKEGWLDKMCSTEYISNSIARITDSVNKKK